MKNLRFSSRPRAKVRLQGPPGSARAQPCIQIERALWRKVRPLLCRNKKLYASKEVKENALASEGKFCPPETKTTVNRYVCHDLSV